MLELAYEHMNEPEKVTVETEFVTADRVRQIVYFPANEEKLPLLIGLLSAWTRSRTMVFVNTKVWCEKVAQRARARAFPRRRAVRRRAADQAREAAREVQEGRAEMLVATDVAARGLHITDVSHVFNYDLPFDAEDYVHRIGRTARLGAEGDAISFACELYAISLPDIEEFIGQKIPVATVDRRSSRRSSASRSTPPKRCRPRTIGRRLPRHIREKPAKRSGAGGAGSSSSRSRSGPPSRTRAAPAAAATARRPRSEHPEPVASAPRAAPRRGAAPRRAACAMAQRRTTSPTRSRAPLRGRERVAHAADAATRRTGGRRQEAAPRGGRGRGRANDARQRRVDAPRRERASDERRAHAQ